MKTRGKALNMFFLEGDTTGRAIYESLNWTGKVYRIPREFVKKCDDRPELNFPGVYILLGKEQTNQETLAYIGETEEIRERIVRHLTDQDFWDEVWVVISSGATLNKAHVKYLEARLYDMARKAGKCRLKNSYLPAPSKISEADKGEMEEFIEWICFIMGAVRIKIFETPVYDPLQPSEGNTLLFYLHTVKGGNACGQWIPGGFKVFKGSVAASSVAGSCPDSWARLRTKLTKEKIIGPGCQGHLVFLQDCVFSSPSAAASVIAGKKINGRTAWKLKDQRTLKMVMSSSKGYNELCKIEKEES